MAEHIIWDWNGTLLDDLEVCFGVTNRLLKQYGKPPFENLEAYRNSFFFPVPQWYVGMGLDPARFEEQARLYMDDYMEASKACTLHEDVLDIMEQASRAGFRQTILSASEQSRLEQQMQALDVHVNALGTDNIHAASKKELALQYTRSHPEDHFIFVGDSVHDFEVAKACGADCILVSTGHQAREKLERTGVPVADSLREAWERICSKRS